MAVIGVAPRSFEAASRAPESEVPLPVGGERGALDHVFFSMGREEAAALPAQRRVVLEVAWEALEHAGCTSDRLAGQDVTLFVERRADPPWGSGTRLGPLEVAVTTGDDAEDVLGRAVRRLGGADGCGTALVALEDSPGGTGCAVLVLRRLTDAVAEGDRVLAVLGAAASRGEQDPVPLRGAGPEGVVRAVHAARRGEAGNALVGGGDGTPVRFDAPPPRPAPVVAEPPSPMVFPLSGASPSGLRENAARLAGLLASPEAPELADVAWTLTRHRTPLTARAVVVAGDADEVRAGLRAVAAQESAPGVATGAPVAGRGTGVVWVFSGDGSQWTGMGRELLEREPAFADFLNEVDPVFRAEGGYSPVELLTTTDVGAARVGHIQGLCFAVQAALAAVWRDHGVEPAAVIGHSGGEIAAAVAAGALSPADGALLVCRRSALLHRVAGRGTMALVDLPPAEVDASLAGRDDVVVGIWASPLSTVVSGDLDAVRELVRLWEARGRFVREVATDIAPHSPHMDPLLDEVRARLAELAPRRPLVPLYSTSQPGPRGATDFGAGYWAGNLRNPVRFDTAVAAAAQDGHRVFVEVSGHPLVTQALGEILADQGVTDAVVLPTLLRNRPERRTFHTHLGALHCHGVPVDVNRQGAFGRLVDLPPYAWQRAEDGDATAGEGPEETVAWRLLAPDDLAESLTALVRRVVTGQLGVAPADLDDRRPLAEYGMESLATLRITRRLAEQVELPLPATLLWNHPTVQEVVTELSTRLGGKAPPGQRAEAEPHPVASAGTLPMPSGFEQLLDEVESLTG
ncbi:hypothetical protein AQ490_16175 [Wenjunlia vitaminophila]|uniref:Carrier domain-containing protein n=1 Tax=Wenjunlia vitaminophila TaxID=76728 RepID=A0A0T6LWZ7_WENVI|nr:hypothetical protein AQ490_16175 [Wenjunlia vitaminophila]